MLNKNLYQIIRDIGLLRDKWKSKIKLIKIIVLQDKKKSTNQLTWLEYLNTKCNCKAKDFILQESREIIPFIFDL